MCAGSGGEWRFRVPNLHINPAAIATIFTREMGRKVQVGGIILITQGPALGKLAVIVDIIDTKRVFRFLRPILSLVPD